MAWRFAASLAWVGLAGACSGCATKLDFAQVSGGRERDAAVADATSSSDAASEQRAVDARVAEMADAGQAEVEADAAVVATAPDAEAPDVGSFRCAQVSPAPWFCDDFEPPSELDDWSGLRLEPDEPGVLVSVDGRAGRSGTRSLLATIEPGVVDKCLDCLGAAAVLKLNPLTEPVQLSVDFDMRVDAFDSTPGRHATPFQLVLGTPEEGYTQETLELESAGTTLRAAFVEYLTPPTPAGAAELEQSEQFRYAPMSLPTPGTWMHVHFALSVTSANGGGNRAQFTVDDSEWFSGPLHWDLHAAAPALEFGLPWVETATFHDDEATLGWQIRFDNVLIVVIPG